MNNDLISRSALLEEFGWLISCINAECADVEDSMERIKKAPAVDAVEVVRCRDCKHYQDGNCGQITYIMDGYYRDTFEVKSPDDFCSRGEKMDVKKCVPRKCCTCSNDGWDMPQCRECNEGNGFKWYKRNRL